ncbi:MAG TPA: protein kinase [Candidatus Udaeobacter sp.]|jgi:TolB-like protein/Tfp pilus assembly protein PilF
MNILGVCEKCGAEFFSDASQEFCSACLLETGLFSNVSVAAGIAVVAGDDCSVPGENGKTTHAAQPAHRVTDFGDYELLEKIGRGSQGLVYRARQKRLNRTVALKIVGLGQFATKAHLQRFHLEAEAAASLDHPCIVPIYEIGERDGSCYFSMKLVEGEALDEVVRRGPLPVRHAAEIIAKLAHAVHYAHERGVLHRDIKPGNILLDAKGDPHLTDFGLARLVETESTVTCTTDVLGTPSYMAPEQARGQNGQVTSATDVYGLGAAFYHLLTSHPPFAGGTTYETVRLLLETEPRQPRLLNPKAGRDLSTSCLKCLEKDPKHRYSSALALAEDLERWLRREPIKARRSGVVTCARKWVQRKPAIAALIASLVALAAVTGWNIWKSELVRRPATTGIAVLPFENLSNDREDASFADGVQDDLLTKLANIAALKVISRTSVMQYRGKQNIREIGDALRVSHVLEGSVRKTGAWLHINAQLIDTRTDSHMWAKQYDGDIKDLFTIQSQIAQNVAEQLHAKISAEEKVAIEQPPTADLTAFDLYSRAKNLILTWNYSANERGDLLKAADLLNQAVANDPSFFQAYCQIAWVQDHLYFLGFDRTTECLALAETAVKAAFRLRPEAGEAYLSRALNLYLGHRDYDGALAALKIASKSMPNDSRLFELRGYIERRRPGGNQEQALRNLERAIELDPRNVFVLGQAALSYALLRRYADEKALVDRVLEIQPGDVVTRVERAFVEFNWKADSRPLHQLIDEIRVKDPSAIQSVAFGWVTCELAERDPVAAANALAALGQSPFGEDVQFPPEFVEGFIARMAHDENKARSAFIVARTEQEKSAKAQPNYGPALCALGLIDAVLGRKEEALREGRLAVKLLPVEKDALIGPLMISYLAMISAWTGDTDLACEQLAIAIHHPNAPSYGSLKLEPFWDPLRGDPRFEKIVASLAPKEK